MPPKKSKKSKKKKSSGNDDGTSITDPKHKACRLELETQALNRQLLERTEYGYLELAARRELESQLQNMKEELEEEQKIATDIEANMTRQYKAMQEDLMSRIDNLNKTITKLKDEIDHERGILDHTWRETEQLVGQKDAEIAEQKQKMEEMAHEFGDMLKETLDKMSERIDVNSTAWDPSIGLPVLKQLEEMNFAEFN